MPKPTASVGCGASISRGSTPTLAARTTATLTPICVPTLKIETVVRHGCAIQAAMYIARLRCEQKKQKLLGTMFATSGSQKLLKVVNLSYRTQSARLHWNRALIAVGCLTQDVMAWIEPTVCNPSASALELKCGNSCNYALICVVWAYFKCCPRLGAWI